MPEYYCFADFEFTCGGNIGVTTCEMLSVGAVICSSDYTVAECFYCTARPVCRPKLTKQCRKLTKLTQEEISSSPDSNDVLLALMKLLKSYSVKEVWVWGNFDKPALSSDARSHQLRRKDHSGISGIANRVKDIQDEVVKKLELPQAVSIEELSTVFGYKPSSGTFHNALNDAMAFYCIHRAAYTTDLAANADFLRLRQERIDRLREARERAEQKRIETAMSVPLTHREQEYVQQAKDSGSIKVYRRFIAVRSKLVKAQSVFPDGARLAAVYFPMNRMLRVFPEDKLDETLLNPRAKVIRFTKNELDVLDLL